MKHKLYIFLSLTCLGSLVSCGCSSIWRPELEEFIFKTKYTNAVQYVDKALLEANLVTTDVDGKELQSRNTMFYFEQEINKPYFYHLVETTNDPNISYSKLDRKMYKDQSDDNYYFKEIKDGVETFNSTSEDYILSHLSNFFSTSEDNGFKGGGMFRGDELKTMSHLQFYMYIDEEKNELVYQYNKQEVGDIISTMLYRINSEGLILSYDLLNELPNVKTSKIVFSIKYNDDAIYDENKFRLE